MATGFMVVVDATLPTGALDNDWYEVSAGGYFHGKTTRAGQFVKLIRGKTDLIVVDDPTVLTRSVNGVAPVDGDVTLAPADIGAIPATEKGSNSGVATLTSGGKLAQTVDGANVNQDSTHRLVTDAEKSTWDGKQDAITTTTEGALIHSATEKPTPVDADEMGIVDSAASNILKKLTWANLKATLYAQLANVANGFIGIIYVDTWANCLANKPAASNSGKFILVTDRYNGALFRSNGTCYDRVGGGPIVDDTIANIVANYNATTYNGCSAFATDLGKSGVMLYATDGRWVVKGGDYVQIYNNNLYSKYIVIGGSGATWAQSGTTITVTWTGHNIPADFANGANVYLTQGTLSTGSNIASAWYTNLTVVDANTFTCTSSVSQSGTGSLGSNTAQTFLPDVFTFPDSIVRRGTIFTPSCLSYGKSSPSNKTVKMQIGGINIYSVTNVFMNSNINSGNMFWLSDTTFIVSNFTTSVQTAPNKTWRVSVQLSAATDFHIITPSHCQFFGG